MAKKRKTLRDKQKAALRQPASKHQAAVHIEQQVTKPEPMQEQRQKFSYTTTQAPARTLHTPESYSYLLHDLKKTTLITGGIVIAQVALVLAMQGM